MTVRSAAVLVALACGPLARAQTVMLAEAPKPGECSRYTTELTVTGYLIVTQDTAKQPVKVEARGKHRFTERTLTAADGLPANTARHYEEAAASASVGGEKFDRALAADRRVIAARRSSEGLFCFAPAGPLTRDELDLITEHFNPHCLPGLLPGGPVKVGDSWPVTNPAAQAACLFDGLIKHTLAGKLTGVAGNVATFTITGSAEGIEHGARVALEVTATGKYDTATGRIVELTWKQTDDRGAGPINPASKVEASVTLRREALPAPPAELADAALAAIPAGDVPPLMTALQHADPKDRYHVVYPRDWNITGQTDTHLVMRLLDRGELVCQATITAWKKAEPGKHVSADEFKKAVFDTPGWVPGKVLDDGELPTDAGRWLYRVTAEGRMEDVPVIQSFHLLAGPQGDQVAVTVAMRPEKARAVGTRDVGLVNAIEFGVKK
jgi:hypothetical protein